MAAIAIFFLTAAVLPDEVSNGGLDLKVWYHQNSRQITTAREAPNFAESPGDDLTLLAESVAGYWSAEFHPKLR